MSEKLQEWIEAVDRALVLCRDCRLDDTADLIAELAAYLRDGGWLPIESAPKDGTLVLLFEPHSEGGFCFVGCQNIDGNWVNNLDFMVQKPTHYRPLPAPPAALATPGGEE
jgi:hypothetical protein